MFDDDDDDFVVAIDQNTRFNETNNLMLLLPLLQYFRMD